MDDDDPLERLLEELLDAHDRLAIAKQPDHETKRSRRRIRPVALAVSAVALALTASAAAAILIEVRRSAPLSGTLPHQLLATRYALRVAPDLSVGHAGWCVVLLDRRTGTSVLATPTSCVSPGSKPLIIRGGIEVLSPSTGAIAGWLLYAVVHEGVAALRAPDGTRILPISSPLLPRGWRAAVTIATTPSVGARRATIATLTPVDSRGRTLSTRTAKPVVLRTRSVNPERPPPTGCRITTGRLPGVRLLGARGLVGTLPKSLATATEFLTCYSLTLGFRGQIFMAALLVNAQHPGRLPGPLLGAKSLPGRAHAEFEPAASGARAGSQTERLIAKRAGDAWLVIQTVAPTHMALALLEDLTACT